MVVDWDSITHLFQLPLRWFREIDRRSWLITDGVTLEVDRNNPEGTELKINKSGLGIPDKDTGSPVDGKDSPNVLDTNGASWTWQAGGDNGLELDCYCRIAPQQAGSAFSVFQRVRMTFSKSGLLVSAELLTDRIRLRASNS